MKSYEDFKDKPLPEHTKINIMECIAQIVLNEMFPNIFDGLIMDDRPDLQDDLKSIGVEVTEANNQAQKRNEALYVKIMSGEIRNKEKAIEIINESYRPQKFFDGQNWVFEPDRFNDGILVGLPDSDSFKRIINAFCIKLEKLNDGTYKALNKYFLFVHSNIFADENMIRVAIEEMDKIQSSLKRKFDAVYVYVPEYLYICDLIAKTGEIISISDKQYGWGKAAREIVIRKEIED